MSILGEIFARKKVEVESCQQTCPLSEVRSQAEAASPTLDFVGALGRGHVPALIAEIKRTSPSKGVLLEHLDPVRLAGVYATNGAAAISILTDRHYFRGTLDDLADVRHQFPSMPLLRKDFIFHPYQVYEARAAGTDALLLIVAGLEKVQLADLQALANELGMAALVEVHTQPELEVALSASSKLVGINNRDLHTFQTNLETTLKLSPSIPPGITVVSESGIRTAADVHRLAQAGVQAILVGEALVTASDPAAKVRELASIPAINLAAGQLNTLENET